MLFLLSPAKTLDFSPAPEDLPATKAELSADTAKLAAVTRKLKPADLRRLMDISEPLAELNVKRFKAFKPRAQVGVQAALAFAGDVYIGLRAREFDAETLDWAQDHLRILSGLYGVLRPLDRIQPYRLEMGTRLPTERGESLYDFWGDRVSKALNRAVRGQPDRTVVNLASQEYFGAVDTKALKSPIVTCQFKEEKDGEARILAFFAKSARGMMARYAIEHRLERAEDLKGFDSAGYRFRPALSDPATWVFTRPQPPLKTQA
ncbi:MAG: peroxide stress protein YaaA [Caulobacteraceae bacterium]